MAKKYPVVTAISSCLTQAHRLERLKQQATPFQRSIFAKGNAAGETARQQLGEGTYIGYMATSAAVQRTDEVLTSGTRMVFEGTVVDDDGQVARLDALEVTQQDPIGIINREVKSSLSKKDKDVVDAAVSTNRARDSGLEVPKTILMHVNRDYRVGNAELAMSEVDITDEVEELLAGGVIEDAEAVIDSEVEPIPVLKRSCRHNPMTGDNKCQFFDQCFGTSEHPVIELSRLSADQYRLFHENGWTDVRDVPDEHLTPGQLRYKLSLMGDRVVNANRLAVSLTGMPQGRISHLDFETSSMPVPQLPGVRPWEQVPEQFSLHVEGEELEHVEYLSPLDGNDNRRQLGERLIRAVPEDGPIMVWGKSMEGTVIRKLANALPDMSEDLLAIEQRLVDLKPIVKKNITDPAFHGSYSLKAVAPVLSHGFSYGGLEIRSGNNASGFLTLMTLGLEEPDSVELRDALLRYCERDTLATVNILQALRTMV